MGLIQQWDEIERGLPDRWVEARLSLTVPDEAHCVRATALLGPFNPGRGGRTIHFATAGRGGAPGPEHVRRLLRKLDEERVEGTLALVATEVAAPEPTRPHQSLVGEWEAALAVLPADWSDLYAEIGFVSTDYLERAALLLGPLNPARYDDAAGFRFRVASRFGYGASPQMTRRCLERVDAAGITGEVRILRVLSDTRPVATQGPVWYVGGHAV
jgi:hypothetical protein